MEEAYELGKYAKLVDDRNETAHPNGQILFSTQEALAKKINDVLHAVEQIQSHSEHLIRKCYHDFLIASCDPEDREYVEGIDQIRELLIHAHYFSQKDIVICGGERLEEVAVLSAHESFPEVENLHQVLRASFLTD